MKPLRRFAGFLVALAAILAALLGGAFVGLFAFLLFEWILVIAAPWAGVPVLLSFAGVGAFFGLAILAAVWRADLAMNERGLF